MTVRLQRLVDAKFEVGVKESDVLEDFLTLKVLKFPFINLLWLGTFVMAVGFIMSMVRRMQPEKNGAEKQPFNFPEQRNS